MKRALLLPLVVGLAGCEPALVFEAQDCNSLNDARANDNHPPWSSDEGDPEGPRFLAASVEWLSVPDSGCRFDIELNLALREGTGSITAEEVAGTILFAPADFISDSYRFTIQDDAVITRDGENIYVAVRGCAADIDGLDNRRTSFFVKLSDDRGQESDAFCARAFAVEGTSLPSKQSEEAEEDIPA